MSLACDETDRLIMYKEPLRVGTRSDVEFISALSDEVIRRIPESERRSSPCAPGDRGVDIHDATSGKNFNGAYTVMSGFEMRDFLFSISEETARKYLPRHYRRYTGEEIEPRKNQLVVSSEFMDLAIQDEAAVKALNELISDEGLEVKVDGGPSH